MDALRACLIVFFFLLSWEATAHDNNNTASEPLKRNSFPPGFIFGTASSAYQIEGAVEEDGKRWSIWDTFTNLHPERIMDGSNGNIAIDSYHRYKEDVKIIKEIGWDAYKFSISWTRILPNGRGKVNKAGITFYKNLINEIISSGLIPFATIFHWDTPQVLEDEYGGFMSPKIVEDFRNYAEICFKEFGHLVKHWITINEPWNYCSGGYSTGHLAPGHCQPPLERVSCDNADEIDSSGTEPYTVAHNMLITHAVVVKLYREKYWVSQKGAIGLTHLVKWFVPFSDSKCDQEAAERALDFMYGWFMDPLNFGVYPPSMRALVGDRLPKFTEEQSEMIKGSFDFIGINYYTANCVYDTPLSEMKGYNLDAHATQTGLCDGEPIGPVAASAWLYVYPPGLRELLLYTKNKYNNPLVYVTENGVDEPNNSTLPLEEALKDDKRINFHEQHMLEVLEAVRRGVNVKGYFAWAIFDNFEWDTGYTVRFGINYVDFDDNLKRYPKKSASWFKNFLHNEGTICLRQAM